MSGVIEHVYTAPAEGAPTAPTSEAELITGVGVAGDRYANRSGHFSDPKYADQQLTLVEAEAAEMVGIMPSQTRRNIITRGVDLNALIGCTFRIGETEIRGVRECAPCSYLESLTRPGLVKDMAGRGGLRAEILRGGQVRVGDAIVVVQRVEEPTAG